MGLTRRSFLAACSWIAARASDGNYRYRASATISLLGVPIFTRDNVGGAWLSLRPGHIEFAAGSIPARARGLNRIGYIRETVDANGSAYFGFMTASREKSLKQAKVALEGAQAPVFVVASGWARNGRHVCDLRDIDLGPPRPWTECAAMAVDAEQRLQSGGGERRELASGTTDTFLHAILRALRGPRQIAEGGIVEGPIVHNGSEFLLRLKPVKSRESGRWEGQIKRIPGGEPTGFTLWADADDPNGPPRRFEFQARSFLKLTFARE